ncbi:complex I NDUFA9 subunit family protein [Chitiniphilus purpureus]|uniref:Complex I NDUFA9 subunit family protein n=1 Tax=Chitiniphilus purpureus TaxID=2981137 RepID=A0ABY6DLD6_9NEIS|nr:complex I NDUFA9 subunit family protein [Chitiniphilus sp. CD1]UXY15172.1 complex I NDUFA9 subunit family protein [Chitiniphilus sp. CD1]
MPTVIAPRICNVLLVGGSGFIGSRLAARLAGAGHTVTLPTRDPARARDALLLPQLQIVGADVHDPAQLARLAEGKDVVINLVGILHGSPGDFTRAHVTLTERIIAACRQAGVPRYLHMSALNAAVDGPSHYLRSKGQAEQHVRASPLAWTLYRPSVVFGPGDRFLNLFARLLVPSPLIPLAGAHARFQPVWVDDVVRAFECGVARPDLVGSSLNLVGPKVYTLAELVRYVGRLTGHPRPILALPDALARLQAAVMGMLPDPLLTRDNLDSMRIDSIDPAGFPAVLGWQPAALEAVAPGYLAAESRPVRRRRHRRR